MSHTIVSNIVREKELRKIQKQTLDILADYLSKSFGPYGSNSTIGNDGYAVEYTKDGKTILEHIQFMGVIENCIRQDIWSITKQVVKEVGDGTTSAVMLSNEVFKGLVEMNSQKQPYQLVREFKNVVNEITKSILENKKEMTLKQVYDIAHLSTNGNDEIATNIMNIYEEYGMDVFIDVSISLNENTMIKVMDGMNLESGLANSAYINTKDNTCEIRNPKIYAFRDPIDTPEMITFLDTIIADNIVSPMQTGEYIPTVIIATRISRDTTYYLNQILSQFTKLNPNQRPPLLVIDGLFEFDKFDDIIKMAGCKGICKYIDPKQQEKDIELGIAPTPQTIHEFAGSCELIVSDVNKTKFINPALMRDVNGEYTQEYHSLLDFVNKELNKAIAEGENASTIGTYRRRLQSLKGNLVDYLVGGISVADRDSDRALIEDAVLNIRSAVTNGYGRAANYEGFYAVKKYCMQNESDIAELILNAYERLLEYLYATAGIQFESGQFFNVGLPLNIRTEEFDDRVVSSIQTDVVILTAISKIVTLMFTSNQFICNNIAHNIYN